MKIIYITTSLCEDDYPDFQKLWKIPLNSSNQNFHNKVIRALGKYHHVDVVSLRPFSITKCGLTRLYREKTIKDNVTYHYLKVTPHRLFRNVSFKRQASKLIKSLSLEDTIILTDTINPKTIALANKIKKKYHLPVVGLCTDSPSNISGTSRNYTLYLFNQSKNLDGYISLTKELNDLFNASQKPSLIVEGIVEEKLPEKIENKYGKYFFLGGALMKRYGVYDLINSFKKLPQKDINLLICGHHYDEETLKKTIGEDKRIHFLKCLINKEVLKLEMNAFANINPRPYSEDLDRFSIPSKTLEYLRSGQPVISVKNSKLMKKFPEEIIWAKSSQVEDLSFALNHCLELTQEERKALGEKGKEKVLELYSLSTVGKQISEFLASNITK